MSKDAEFKNRDRYIQLGIAISTLRKMRGLSQEQLAERANVSRSHISSIEAPGIARPFSLEVFFNIADALEIDPADLINASVFPDKVIRNNSKGLCFVYSTDLILCDWVCFCFVCQVNNVLCLRPFCKTVVSFRSDACGHLRLHSRSVAKQPRNGHKPLHT